MRPEENLQKRHKIKRHQRQLSLYRIEDAALLLVNNNKDKNNKPQEEMSQEQKREIQSKDRDNNHLPEIVFDGKPRGEDFFRSILGFKGIKKPSYEDEEDSITNQISCGDSGVGGSSTSSSSVESLESDLPDCGMLIQNETLEGTEWIFDEKLLLFGGSGRRKNSKGRKFSFADEEGYNLVKMHHFTPQSGDVIHCTRQATEDNPLRLQYACIKNEGSKFAPLCESVSNIQLSSSTASNSFGSKLTPQCQLLLQLQEDSIKDEGRICERIISDFTPARELLTQDLSEDEKEEEDAIPVSDHEGSARKYDISGIISVHRKIMSEDLRIIFRWTPDGELGHEDSTVSLLEATNNKSDIINKDEKRNSENEQDRIIFAPENVKFLHFNVNIDHNFESKISFSLHYVSSDSEEEISDDNSGLNYELYPNYPF